MSSKQKATNELDPSGGNVEQIREILFGGHIRAFDERFDLVESRLAKESATLQKALEKRLQELERKLSEVREEASDKLGVESSNRDLALNKIELALSAARMEAENQIAQLKDSLNADIKAVRSELNAAKKELSTALSRAERSQLRRADKLDEDKVDRKELSKFFSEIAQKIQPTKAKQGR
jgi:uncharacterized protein (UPF0210 family)